MHIQYCTPRLYPAAVRPPRIHPLLLGVLLSVGAASSAQAGLGPASTRTTQYLNPGVAVGVVMEELGESVGPTLGVRLSLNEVTESLFPIDWDGLYGHLQYDFSGQAWRGGVGVGTGVLIFGAELGLVGVADEQGSALGVEVGVVATIGLCGLYLRHTQLGRHPSLTELGLRFGLPFKAD